MLRDAQGLSLIEILVASVVGVMLAGGTMMAFVMARRTVAGSSDTTEATTLAQQTIERLRNRIACDDRNADGTPRWFNAADCTATGLASGWQTDPLPGGTTGIQAQGATRQYQVTKADCDMDGTAGDCLQVDTKVSWTPSP